MPPTDVSSHLARMGYRRARQLFALGGLTILAVLLAVLAVRAVDSTEVAATLLYGPLFLALLLFGLPGGVLGALAATGVYVALRSDSIDVVGWGDFGGLVLARGVAYLLFGTVGGWAARTLELSLDKLDLYDQIDDQTGLNNARFLLQDVDLERSRSERYKTVFSVSFAEFDAAPIDRLPVRQRRKLLRELGLKLEDATRSVDRVAHGYDGVRHRLATILPETASEGATIFHSRLVDNLRTFLTEHGIDEANFDGGIATVPGDDSVLEGYLAEWRQIDKSEHELSPA